MMNKEWTEKIRQREINRINEQRKQEALEKHTAQVRLSIHSQKYKCSPRIKWEIMK